jgi:hypothetical protein
MTHAERSMHEIVVQALMEHLPDEARRAEIDDLAAGSGDDRRMGDGVGCGARGDAAC